MKCPNSGTERFKKATTLVLEVEERAYIPKNVVMTEQIKVGQCSKAGCGKTVIYVAA